MPKNLISFKDLLSYNYIDLISKELDDVLSYFRDLDKNLDSIEDEYDMEQDLKRILKTLNEEQVKEIEDEIQKKYDVDSLLEDFERFIKILYKRIEKQRRKDAKNGINKKDDYDLDGDDIVLGEDDTDYSRTTQPTTRKFRSLRIEHKKRHNKLEYCTYNQFMLALEDVKDKSEDLKTLYNYLTIPDDEYAKNSIEARKTAKSYRFYVSKQLNGLEPKDLQRIINKLNEYEEYERYGINIKYIANEFGRRVFNTLMDRINEPRKSGALEENIKEISLEDNYPFFETNDDYYGLGETQKNPGYQSRKFKFFSSNKSRNNGSRPSHLGEIIAEKLEELRRYDRAGFFVIPKKDESTRPGFGKVEVGTRKQELTNARLGSFAIGTVEEGNFGGKTGYINLEKGVSIVNYLDYRYNAGILNYFINGLRDIEANSVEDYLRKSSKLIDDATSYSLLFDKPEELKEVFDDIKETYCLKMVYGKEPSKVLEELICDELRYLQVLQLYDKQKVIDPMKTYRRIGRELFPINGETMAYSISELKRGPLPSYTFDERAFKNFDFSFKCPTKKHIKDGFIKEELTSNLISNAPDITWSISDDGTVHVKLKEEEVNL